MRKSHATVLVNSPRNLNLLKTPTLKRQGKVEKPLMSVFKASPILNHVFLNKSHCFFYNHKNPTQDGSIWDMKGKQAMGRKKSLTWSKIKMSSAKQTNKQVCAEASLLNKMEKKT